MKSAKRGLALAMVAMLAVGATGCQLVKVDSEKDMKQVVAKVNDTEILKSDYQAQYDQTVQMYQMYGQEAPEDLSDTILNQMIQQEVLKQKVKSEGLENFNEEQQKEYDEYENSMLDQYSASFTETATAELGEGASEEDITKRSRELLEEDVNKMEDYSMDDLREELKLSFAMGLLSKQVAETIEVSDADIQTWYDENLETQKTQIESDPTTFESLSPQLYMPEGYRKVKHILTKFSDEITNELATLRTKQTEISTEWGSLSAADEKGNSARIQELRDENTAVLAEMEGLKADTLARAEEVLTKVEEPGADFDALIVEYSEDTAGEETADPETTFTVGPDTTTLVAAFVEASVALKEGEISGLVETDYGYHIIKDIEDIPAGPVALADVKDEVKTVVEAQKQTEAWNDAITTWESEATIERYPDALTDNTENYDSAAATATSAS